MFSVRCDGLSRLLIDDEANPHRFVEPFALYNVYQPANVINNFFQACN